jgi:hypothetical protein
MKKIIALALALVQQQPALASAGGLLAGAAAGAAGHDPWPWVIGAAGAAIVFAKRPATTRLDALVNTLISICIGGLIGPAAAAGAEKYLDLQFDVDYAMCFALSAAWPWVLPGVLTKIKRKIDAA